MPNIKAAIKWVRQSEKRELRNKDVKTRLKTIYKKTVAAVDTAAAKDVESEFDQAAKKGIIHPNKAARKKSRLAAALRRAANAPEKPTKAKGGTKARGTKKAAGKKTSKKTASA